MDASELIEQAKRITNSGAEGTSMLPEAQEFLRVYAGERSAFFKQLNEVNPNWDSNIVKSDVIKVLRGFIRFVEHGLLKGISIERKAQTDVVSDFLEQAQTLLDSTEVHPAAPTVVIGAALEEFLRNWIEEAGIDLGGQKPSLDSYKNVLREAELITKQDAKDITAWGGLRNHAAHGEWEEVSDKTRVSLMLEGVNLFMRKYTSPIS